MSPEWLSPALLAASASVAFLLLYLTARFRGPKSGPLRGTADNGLD